MLYTDVIRQLALEEWHYRTAHNCGHEETGSAACEFAVACPIFCTSEIVSGAQLSLSSDSRRRGCGEVGSA
jgi:hypothetical protein